MMPSSWSSCPYAFGSSSARPVAAGRALGDQVPQPGDLRVPRGHRERRQLRRHQRQVERALQPEQRRVLHRPPVAHEPPPHLLPRAHVGLRRRRQPPVQLLHAAPRPHRRHRRRQPPVPRVGVVHVVRRHRPHTQVRGHPREQVVVRGVQRKAVIDQLHHHVPAPEPVHQPRQLLERRPRPRRRQGVAHRALAAAGQHHGVTGQLVHHLVQVVDRPALLPAPQVRVRDHPAQPPVPRHLPRQHQQMPPRRIRNPVLRPRQPQAQLRAVHRAHPQLPRRVGEAHHPVHPVVVGQRERVQPRPRRLLHQPLRMRRPVQEAEVRVRVQLRIRHPGQPGTHVVPAVPLHQVRRRPRIPLPTPRPRRTVPAITRRGLHPPRQRPLQLRPRPAATVEPHTEPPSTHTAEGKPATERMFEVCAGIATAVNRNADGGADTCRARPNRPPTPSNRPPTRSSRHPTRSSRHRASPTAPNHPLPVQRPPVDSAT